MHMLFCHKPTTTHNIQRESKQTEKHIHTHTNQQYDDANTTPTARLNG